MSNKKLRILIKYALVGAAIGTLFPVFATIRELITLDLPITFANAMRAQRGQPLLWLIDTAPIILALSSLMAGTRKAALVALLEDERSLSTRRTRAILDTTVEGIITIDSSGRVLSFNRGAVELFGYSADEVIGKNVSLLMPDPHRSQHDGYLRSYLDTGVKKIIGIGREVMGRRRDGTTFPLRLAVGEMQLAGGETAFVGTLHDLTEEKRLTEEIERFFRVSIDLLCIATLDGYFKRVNPAFTDLLGYTEEELLARPFLDFVHPDDREATAAELGRLGEGAATMSFENRYLLADGSFRYLAWNAMPYVDDGVVYAIAHDVTELKEREEELQLAKQEADRANESKGQFLANMSHEIRTPMNGVLGLTDLALNTDLTDQQRQYLKMVQNSGRALMDTLNSILDFSKIEAGKFQLEDIDFAIRGTLSGVMKPISITAQHKGVELVYDESPGIPELVRGDPGRLRQVLLNLVGNAVKFTFKGSVQISMEKVRDLDDGVEIRFEVRDSGIGIPADKLDHIFESFHQADGSTTRRYGGTGLGLSIASGIVSMMGGELGVESEEGRGSTFHFTVAFANAHQPASEISQSAKHLRGRRALVVDDNQVNRQIVESFLTRLDMEVESVSSGAEAGLEDPGRRPLRESRPRRAHLHGRPGRQ
jgi:PAS domain S-box-containing protein